MNTHFKIIMLLILFLTLSNLTLDAENTYQGTYVPSVILSAPWGEKCLRRDSVSSDPGKFGFGLNAEGLEVGPTAFTVAPDGDIYIGDALNERVQRFSAEGNFIKVIPNAWGDLAGLAVDQDGNIYCPNTYTGNPAVYKFDQNGNQVKIYPIVKDEEMGTDRPYNWSAFGISCDDSGKVFIQYRKMHSGTKSIIQVGTKDSELPFAQQKAMVKEADFGATANVPNGNKIFREVGLLGVDKDAVYTVEKDEKNPDISIIKKCTYDGRLIATYTVNWSQVNCPLLTSFSMNMRTVFDKGNIYIFCSDKEGIRIIKWSPVEGGK